MADFLGGLPMDVNGDWRLDVDTPMGKQSFIASLQEKEGLLGGVFVNNGNNMTTNIFDGSVNGDELNWKVQLQQMRIVVAFNVTVLGDSMTGKAKVGAFGSFSVSGKREPQA
jgi:hypothetical protein